MAPSKSGSTPATYTPGPAVEADCHRVFDHQSPEGRHGGKELAHGVFATSLEGPHVRVCVHATKAGEGKPLAAFNVDESAVDVLTEQLAAEPATEGEKPQGDDGLPKEEKAPARKRKPAAKKPAAKKKK